MYVNSNNSMGRTEDGTPAVQSAWANPPPQSISTHLKWGDKFWGTPAVQSAWANPLPQSTPARLQWGDKFWGTPAPAIPVTASALQKRGPFDFGNIPSRGPLPPPSVAEEPERVSPRFSKIVIAHGMDAQDKDGGPFELLPEWNIEIVIFSQNGQVLEQPHVDALANFFHTKRDLPILNVEYFDGRKYIINNSSIPDLHKTVKWKVFKSAGTKNAPCGVGRTECDNRCPNLHLGCNDIRELAQPQRPIQGRTDGFVGVYEPSTFSVIPPGRDLLETNRFGNQRYPVAGVYGSGKDEGATMNLCSLIGWEAARFVSLKYIIPGLRKYYESIGSLRPENVMRLFVVSCSAIIPGISLRKQASFTSLKPIQRFGRTMSTMGRGRKMTRHKVKRRNKTLRVKRKARRN
jgi:hypothetical protein